MTQHHPLVFRAHALQKMFERQIQADDVAHVIATGDVIKDYPDDQPYPSCLILGWVGTRPIHVVIATNDPDQETIVITAYEPDPNLWESDFKRKKS